MATLSTVLTGSLGLGLGDWLQLLMHFTLLSLLAVGGAITTVPDMQRFVVGQHGWLNDAQFAGCIALAQAAPGPNMLFVAVIGYNVGGLAGVLATMAGTMLPSSVLAVAASRFGDTRRDSRGVRAFTAGLAPLTIGLMLATGSVLIRPSGLGWAVAGLVGATLWLMLRTKRSPLWAIALGAVAGALGWV
jgi:chromate transporter